MEEHRILKFLDKISFIYERSGVDYKTMRRILNIKLIMDGRRTPSMLSMGKEDKERSGFMNILLAYGIGGIFIMFFMFLNFPIFVKMSFVLGMILFMIMATMVSDFSTVLLDINDKSILLSKPVDLKTLNAAKLTHICIYLSTITLVFSGPSMILALIKYGIVPFLVFFTELFFISGLIVLVTSILYFIILLFSSGEKLKDIINYFQIFLSILMLISYQLIGRIFDISNLKLAVKPEWWHFIIPSTWFAAPFGIVTGQNNSYNYYVLSLMGIIVPILAFLLYIKFVSPYFEKNLQKLSSSTLRKNNRALKYRRINKLFSDLICWDKTESFFFRFTQIMISNERKLKLKIYPSLAYAVFMPLVFLLNYVRGNRSISEAASMISSHKLYFTIYISVAMLLPILTMISRSDNYNGAWIYKVLPLETPAPIFKGAFKGFVVKCIIPANLIISLIFLVLCGIKILPDIILILLNIILLSVFIANRSDKLLPFSKDFKFTQDNNTSMGILLMFLCGGLAGIHYILGNFKFGITIGSIVTLIVIFIYWKNTYKISWRDV